MPIEQHTVGWYEPSGPIRMEVITDHTGWREIEPYGVGYLPGCYSGTVDSEPGYVRAFTLFGDDPQAYGGPSNMMALSEPPMWASTFVALVVVMGLARWRNGRGGRF